MFNGGPFDLIDLIGVINVGPPIEVIDDDPPAEAIDIDLINNNEPNLELSPQ